VVDERPTCSIAVLRQSIVPRLVAEAPQPGAEALAADAPLLRLTLIFDREAHRAGSQTHNMHNRFGMTMCSS
jgi:hypothetical protein